MELELVLDLRATAELIDVVGEDAELVVLHETLLHQILDLILLGLHLLEVIVQVLLSRLWQLQRGHADELEFEDTISLLALVDIKVHVLVVKFIVMDVAEVVDYLVVDVHVLLVRFLKNVNDFFDFVCVHRQTLFEIK